MPIKPAPGSWRRSSWARAAMLAVMVLVATPGAVAAAAPVAVDDPSIACGNTGFGGAFPIPEDFTGGTPGFETWFYLFGPCGPLANDTDGDADVLTWTVVDEPPHGEVLKVDESSFAYRPDPDFSTTAGDQPGGTWFSDAFTYRANDGATDSNLGTYRFWIAPINDPPTFVAAADVTVAEDGGPYVAPWATAVSPGPASEAQQVVAFELDVAEPGLFSAAPAMDADGILTFTPAVNVAGTTEVTVRAVDDGGLEDYGLAAGTMIPPDDTSDATTFTITVTAVNDAPVGDTDHFIVPKDAGPVPLDVLDGDVDVDDTALEISSADNGRGGTVVVAPDRQSLTFQPKPGRTGRAVFTYVVADPGDRRDVATVIVDIVAPTAFVRARAATRR